MKRHVLILAVGLVCGVVLGGWAGAGRSEAATTPGPSKLALIKQNDLAVVGRRYAPDFRWIACGLATGPPHGSRTGRCRRGQVPTYGSYWALKSAIAAGKVTSGMTVLFDQETWKWTPPREQAHPRYFIRAAAQLARAHGVFIIESVYEPTMAAEIAVEVAAAPYADVIAIQSQKTDQHPEQFTRYVAQSAAAIRAVSPDVAIMAGLATDAGGHPVTAAMMDREYDQTYAMVSYFWLNAAQWPPPTGHGCAPRGCGAIGARFLADIAVAPSR